jgi:hypothetical protein
MNFFKNIFIYIKKFSRYSVNTIINHFDMIFKIALIIIASGFVYSYYQSADNQRYKHINVDYTLQ